MNEYRLVGKSRIDYGTYAGDSIEDAVDNLIDCTPDAADDFEGDGWDAIRQ